ncbi:CHAT domain-containing protein [Streptomyces sp. NPDC002845]
MPDKDPKTRLPSPGAAFLAQVMLWPTRTRLVWWGIRPMAGAAALTAAAFSAAVGGAWAAGLAAALITLLVRPVTRPWAALPAVMAVAFLVPAAGFALAVRWLATVLAIRWSASNWTEGLQVVRGGRRALLGFYDEFGTVDEEWAKLATRASDMRRDLDLKDSGWILVLAAWCEADVRVLASTTAEVLSSLWTGVWRFPVAPGIAVHEVRAEWSGRLALWVPRLTAMGAAAGAVMLLGLDRPASLFGVSLPDWSTAAIAALAAWWALQREWSTKTVLRLVLCGVLAYAAYGRHMLGPILCGLTAAAAAAKLRSLFERHTVGRKERAPGLPWCRGWLGARQTWTVARRAADEKKTDVARTIWSELAASSQTPAPVRSAAAAALAYLALQDGDTQSAVEHSTGALGTMPARTRVTPLVKATAGRALLEAGDNERAAELLSEAMRSRIGRRDPLARAAQAKLLSFSGSHAHTGAHAMDSSPRASSSLIQLLNQEIARATDGQYSLHHRQRELKSQLQHAALFDEAVSDKQVLRQLRQTRAHGWLVLGQLQLELGPGWHRTAAQSLHRAVEGLPSGTMEHAVARTLRGAALTGQQAPQKSMELLRDGVRAMEQHRGQLTAGRHRGQLIGRYEDVYARVFSSTVRLQRSAPEAGLLAAELAESLRRSGLARALRERQKDIAPHLQEERDRIAALEEQASGGSEEEQQACRQALETKLSTVFASAYLPRPVDYTSLRAAAGTAHILTYHVERSDSEHLVGHVVWAPPDAPPVVTSFDIRDAGLLALLGNQGHEARKAVMSARQTPQERLRWQQMCMALIPPQARTQLMKHEADYPADLLIVPDGPLAALPWAALRLDDGRLLVKVAVSQLIPTLDLLSTRPPHENRGLADVLVYLGMGNETDDSERAFSNSYATTTIATRTEFFDSLIRSPQGCYLAAHGSGEGLGQYVRFADGDKLSAATALTQPWPPWVVFASCLVGRVTHRQGQEPLGLPISCLLGGADSVIGGVIEVFGSKSGEQATRVAERLRSGEHPARALRAEQLASLSSRSTPMRPFVWAGFICLSRLCLG